MRDGGLYTIMLFLFLLVCALLINQELRLEAIKQSQEVVKVELQELKKKERITAQDVNFLERLIIEGGINEK